MNSLVEQLDKLCRNHRFDEKIIIADTYAIGNQIIQAYVDAGYPAIHLKTKTVRDLAMELVEQNTNNDEQYLEPAVGAHFVYDVLKELSNHDQLTYFKGMEITPPFSNNIYQTITQIRLAGYTSENLNTQAFISSEKANDLALLLTKYEALLTQNGYIDDASLLQRACGFAHPQPNMVYVLQSNLSLTELEHQLLERLLPGEFLKLSLPNIYGVSTPAYEDYRSIAWDESTPFSYLYQLDEITSKPNLSLFAAKTEEIEMKKIFEQIKQLGASLDHSVIFYTKSEPYVTVAYQFSEKFQIPITFGDGLPVMFSRPGKLVKGIVDWMKNQYSTKKLTNLINEGLIDFPEEAPSRTRIVTLLRDAQIGWDQSRYLSQLQSFISQKNSKLTETISDGKKAYYEKQIADATWLHEWFTRLFTHLPKIETDPNFQELLKGISYVLKHYCKVASSLDEIAKTELLEKIEMMLPYSDAVFTNYEAFEKIHDLLLTLNINQSGPQPGSLHICSYRKGLYMNRNQVFIVGLNNRAFPGTPTEDPLLLDEERVQLSGYLPILKDTGKNNLYTMLQLLSLTTGPVSFSYCNFDVNDNRTVSPAHLFLQGYRMVTDQPDAEFKELTNIEAPLIAEDIFETKDFWSDHLASDNSKQIDPSLLAYFTNLSYGIEAEKARQAGEFTVYDGKVVIDAQIYDPRQNKEKTVTAGKLEKLATCPYSYFLEEILQIKPIEELEMDLYAWLDPATRGSLLHSVFENFYKELKEVGEKPIYAQHQNKIIQIAQEKIDEQREIQPPPSERVYRREVDDIFQCCHIFLKEEEEHCATYDPQEFEYTFGIGDIVPAVITLPSQETIHVAGKIDRVDRTADGDFHIIDYKTGGTYSYQENEPFKGGRQLQHFIYALAIEEHLKLEAGSVKESSYYFPSSKGLGERYVRKQNDRRREIGKDMLEKLIDVIKHGHFTMTDDENDCKFCDFKTICRREFYPKETLEAKQMDQHAEGIHKFKGVRAYE